MTFNDYLVRVVYNLTYHLKKYSENLWVGSRRTDRTNQALTIASMYVDLLKFAVDNDLEFEADEIKDVCDHIDAILWTKYADVSTASYVPGTGVVVNRYYGLTTDDDPTVNSAFIDTLNTSSDEKEDWYYFNISGTPLKYCVVAFPTEGIDRTYRLWDDGSFNGYYFRLIASNFAYTKPDTTVEYLDVYITHWGYAANRQFKFA